MDESEKLRLVETLKFQIDEIERAELQPGEEPTPGAVVLKPVHCPPPVWEPSTRKRH